MNTPSTRIPFGMLYGMGPSNRLLNTEDFIDAVMSLTSYMGNAYITRLLDGMSVYDKARFEMRMRVGRSMMDYNAEQARRETLKKAELEKLAEELRKASIAARKASEAIRLFGEQGVKLNRAMADEFVKVLSKQTKGKRAVSFSTRNYNNRKR